MLMLHDNSLFINCPVYLIVTPRECVYICESYLSVHDFVALVPLFLFLTGHFLVCLQMLEWVAEHLPDGEKKRNIQELIREKNYSVKFLRYNWGLNSA